MNVVLSLRQPWAWIVVHGGKTIENRRWGTQRRGPFLIHASKGMTRAEYDDAVDFAFEVNPHLVVPPREQLLFGGIVGRARIVDVLPPCAVIDPANGESLLGPDPCRHPWHMPLQFGFVLADIEAIPFRPLKGELGFFALRGDPCAECKGRGWHVGECHPREECGVCIGTGKVLPPIRATLPISTVREP